jgi:hypothetical protein
MTISKPQEDVLPGYCPIFCRKLKKLPASSRSIAGRLDRKKILVSNDTKDWLKKKSEHHLEDTACCAGGYFKYTSICVLFW